MNYDFLYQYIPVGISRAVHQKDLAEKLHTTPAAVKRFVREARQQGYEICSGQEGYWFAVDENEKQDFVTMMSKQALSRLKSASPIKNTLKQIRGQISLFESLYGATDEVASDEQKKDI